MNAAGKTPTSQVTSFSDVATTDWYAGYVSLAVTEKIISTTQTTFRPNDTITRAEVAKILVGVFGYTPSTRSSTFIDVETTSDLSKYIETAKEKEFFTGQKTAKGIIFRPNDNITRAEIAKVVALAFKL